MKTIALGEVMMRLSTPLEERIDNAKSLDMYFGGGEYNTLINLAQLGNEVSIITKLPSNPLSRRIIAEMKMYNVDSDNVTLSEGRLGTYYTLLGDDITATEVIYDRADSCFAKSTIEDYNFKQIFKGYELFHVSGITAALNSQMKDITKEAIICAKELGLEVSYDSNYRAKLWTQEEAGDFLNEILPYIDFAFLGILDMQYLLKMNVVSLEESYAQLRKEYPNLKLLASTTREVKSTSKHKLSVNLYNGDFIKTKVIDINVKDRIGGGDAFTAGVLDGIIHHKPIQDIADFALANAVIKHYRYGDNMFVTRQEVENLLNGNSLSISR